MLAMLRCEACHSRLDRALRWARLVAEEPEVFVCSTEWGHARFEFGFQEIQVRCLSCGQERLAHRDHPHAAA